SGTGRVLKVRVVRSSRSSCSCESRPLRCKPCDNVGHIAVSQRLAGHVATPIRGAHGRQSDDYNRAQMLVAHKCEVRAIHDGTGSLASAAAHAVAGRAIDGEYGLAVFRVALGIRRMGRRLRLAENSRLSPARPNSTNDDV